MKKCLSFFLALVLMLTCVPMITASPVDGVISYFNNAETHYATLEDALSVAQAGTTIALQTDATVGQILVPNDVTLDLNGHNLTANLIAIAKGQLRDNKGTGKIIVPQDMLMLVGDNNGVLPVWNPADNSYILVTATYQQLLNVGSDQASAQYIFIPNFSAQAIELLRDGCSDNGLAIKVQLTWNNGASQQTYTFTDEMVSQVYASYVGGMAFKVFMLTITGIAGIEDMSIRAIVDSTAGGNIVSSAQNLVLNKPITYTVTFKDYDGTILKTETVESGKAATAPADPVRTDYLFTGWDTAFNNITSDTVITAVYKIAPIDPATSILVFSKLADGTYGVMAGGMAKYQAVIEIPSTYDDTPVTQILSNGFKDLTALQKIEMPNSIKVIGKSAFQGCAALENVTFPEGLESIGAYAFNGCTSLTEVVIPNTVTTIKEYAFYGSNVTSVTIDTTKNWTVSNVYYTQGLSGGNVTLTNSGTTTLSGHYFTADISTPNKTAIVFTKRRGAFNSYYYYDVYKGVWTCSE